MIRSAVATGALLRSRRRGAARRRPDQAPRRRSRPRICPAINPLVDFALSGDGRLSFRNAAVDAGVGHAARRAATARAGRSSTTRLARRGRSARPRRRCRTRSPRPASLSTAGALRASPGLGDRTRTGGVDARPLTYTSGEAGRLAPRRPRREFPRRRGTIHDATTQIDNRGAGRGDRRGAGDSRRSSRGSTCTSSTTRPSTSARCAPGRGTLQARATSRWRAPRTDDPSRHEGKRFEPTLVDAVSTEMTRLGLTAGRVRRPT